MNNTHTILIIITIILIYVFANKNEHFDGAFDKNINVDRDVEIFVINLKSRLEKKNYMQQQLKNHNLNFNIFEAIDGNNISVHLLEKHNVYSHEKSIQHMKRALRKGEIGCALSHILIWYLFSQSQKPYYLIFEDDAILTNNFKTKLEQILNDIQYDNWDVLYLNENCYKHFKHECNGKENTKLTIHPTRIGFGLYGYIINKKFIEKCFYKVHNDNIPRLFPICTAIDVYVDYKGYTNTIKCIRSKEILVHYDKKFASDTQQIH